ncbi:AMP-binding protein [Cerasicoccus maritimus]|uniref:AMP-binding protein n=1 Tax=Cerasicoccus maritimus TaxID=490089 RepID=UPI0028524F25|nr:AMP-binding protein [Cerasicoccus maritimus]
MGAFVGKLEQLNSRPWLACPEQQAEFNAAFAAATEALKEKAGPVVICEVDRVHLLAAVFAAMLEARPVFLTSPAWGAHEWAQAEAQIPNAANVLKTSENTTAKRMFTGEMNAPEAGAVLVPTGGTGGRIKFAVHTAETLLASVRGYQSYWGGTVLNAVCPLPACHIGGLMLALRTALTGGRLWLCDARLEEAAPVGFDLASAHCSVVGAQLRRVLDQGRHWLTDCGAVLVGGGPSTGELVNDALAAGISIYTAYGLTEAAATVALSKVEPGSDPFAGEVLPHWRLEITDGQIQLSGEALFQGYWGEAPRAGEFWSTDDRGALADGRLKVLGRAGRFVITGGRKVDANLLEQRLLAWPEIRDVIALGVPDRQWGEALTVVAVASCDSVALADKARAELVPEMRPKNWYLMDEAPRTAHGKPDWARVYYLINKT